MLFWICWGIDLLMLLVCLYETTFGRSSGGYGTIILLLALLLGGSWKLRESHPGWALALAGLPAGLLVVFGVVYLVLAGRGGNWQ